MIDASWALANRGDGRFDRDLLIGATIAQYPCWVLGTALGALGGDLLGDPLAYGLDAIFPAFFLALLVGRPREAARGRGRAAAALALVLVPFTPAGVPGDRRLHPRRRWGAPAMSATWTTIAGLTVVTAAIKAAGPVSLGGRDLPAWAMSIISLLAPALLAALVVVETFSTDDELVLDARAGGVAAAAVALGFRASLPVTITVAAVAAALLRLVS